MKSIRLTQGYFALIDDEDFPLVDRYTWYAVVRSHTVYATTSLWVEGSSVQLKMHNLIMGGKYVDHKDGNGLNNQKENLRFANAEQNGANRKKKRNSQCKYKGITVNRIGRYQASIGYQGRSIYIGCFSTQEEAAKAYDAKAKELFGEFAKLNFPNSNDLKLHLVSIPVDADYNPPNFEQRLNTNGSTWAKEKDND